MAQPAQGADRVPDPAYFAVTCETVLGDWLRERRFYRFKSYCTESMSAWRRGRHFIRFSYLRGQESRFAVLVGLGSLREGFGLFGMRKPMLHGLGLWEVVDVERDRKVLRDTFRTEGELERLLTSIRDRVLPYAEPVLDDAQKMRYAITHRKRAT
ncbi:MAG: hypothetical protein NVSMB17_14990 [Candidatus Dormibacteria bacterium]